MPKSTQWTKSIPVSIQNRNNPFVGFRKEFDDIFNEFNNWMSTTQLPLEQFENLQISPSVDIIDDKNNFKVEAEMPGLSEKDIKVEINGNMLIITGEKSTSTKDSKAGYLKREISYGKYERSINLPESVDTNKVEASFKKGMLWVSFPKVAKSTSAKKEVHITRA
jgi:HSP20 family protein